MAFTKIRGNTQVIDLSVTNSQIAYPDQATNPVGIELAKIEHGNELIQANGSVAFTAPIAGVTPTQGNHLVTKDYADSVATGLDVKQSVRVIATSNVTLAGAQPIDGIGVVAGDRVLVAGQNAPAENGIYVVSTGAWIRADDADGSPASEVTSGLFTFVEEGASMGSSGWVLATANPITIGTTPLEFVQFSEAGQITAGNGLTLTGSTVDIVSANAGIQVTADAIALKVSADGTLQVKGDGVALQSVTVGQVLVGDNTGVLKPVSLSGDISVNSAGVVTISPGAVGAATIMDGSLALSKLVSGAAGQLIVAGAGGVPAYVTPTGDITVSDTGDLQIVAGSVGSAELADGSVVTTKLGNAAVTNAKLADGSVGTSKLQDSAVTTQKLADASVTLTKLAAVPAGQIIIGTATGNQTVTLSGDVTISETGVATINPATVVRVADMIKRETPVGAVDGANTTFTLANTPKVGTEDVYINGVLQEGGAGNDYTISGAVITMLFPLEAGDKVRVSYFK